MSKKAAKQAAQNAPPEFESIVVGCNTWNCKSKISNANWESKTIEQVTINQGDSINVKASFIDTRGSASGNIEVKEDTEISLEHYFYWVHTFNACDASGLISARTDGSGNLRQQVLVGPDLTLLYFEGIPRFYTNPPNTNTNGSGAFGINDADGLPYLVYVSKAAAPNPKAEPLKKRWSMTLKKGSYDPNYIAELITRNMSRQKTKRVYNVLQSNQKPTEPSSTLNIPTDNTFNSAVPLNSSVWANEANNTAQNTFYDSKNPNVYLGIPGQNTLPTEFDYNLPPDNVDDMPFLFTPSIHSHPLLTNGDSQIWCSIPHWNANGLNNLSNINAGTYNELGNDQGQLNITLHPLISDVRSMSPAVVITAPGETGLPYYTILPFYSQNNSGANGTNGGLFPVTFGATQMSLTYNNEGNQLFSFSYMHSPILAFLDNQSTAVTECTAHMYTTQVQAGNLTSQFYTTQIDKKSGILLHKMEPRGFWEQLGFDVDAITTDFTNKRKAYQMTYNEFNAKTTGGFSGSSNIFNPIFKTIGSADQPSVADTEIVFLQAEPNGSVGPIITAYSPNLVVGSTYRVVRLGLGFVNGGSETNCIYWLIVGGTNTMAVGETFVATTTGFNYEGFTIPPTDDFWDWDQGASNGSPLVELVGQPGVTTTQIQNLYFEVESTNSLDAVRIPEQRDSAGHYLIEITAYPSIYLDDNTKREIKSIVSTYYVSGGSFVSGVFSDSYSYYHVGSPMTISNLKIRLLDPVSMKEIANLGPNSSVYLQINKMLTQQEVAQVEN